MDGRRKAARPGCPLDDQNLRGGAIWMTSRDNGRSCELLGRGDPEAAGIPTADSGNLVWIRMGL